MRQIQAELDSMDYLTSKYVDGEDMSEYGDWQSKRKALREESVSWKARWKMFKGFLTAVYILLTQKDTIRKYIHPFLLQIP